MASRTSQTTISNFQGQKRDNPLRSNDPNVIEYGLNVGFYRGTLYRTPGYGKLFTNMSSGAITSITSVTTTATVTTTVGHGLKTGSSVTIAGATAGGADGTNYNGTYTITVTSGVVFTYTFAGSSVSPAQGTITYTVTTLGNEPAQTIFPTRKFDGTDRLFIGTEGGLWCNNSGVTAFINHNQKDQTGIQITDYAASTSYTWSFANYLDHIYATQYGYAPTYYNKPQVANGDFASAATKAIDGTPSYASNELTINLKSAHGLATGDVIEVAGLTGTTFNPIGTFQCIVTDADSLKIQLFTNPNINSAADSGTICKTHLFGSAYVPVSGFKAKIVRVFENHLIYFNMYDGSKDQPMTFYYSDLGAPTTWASGDANYSAIPDGGDAIMTAEILPPYMAIYKERSIWLLSYTGGTYIWELKVAPSDVGAFGSRSVINLGDRHYFMGKEKSGLFDGFYVFDSGSATLMENQEGIRDVVRNEIDTTNSEMVYAEYLSDKRQCVWHYKSASGSGNYPDKTIIYNLYDKTWHFEELGNANGKITCGAEFELTTSTTIDGLDTFRGGTWTIDTLPYPVDSVYYNGKQRYVLFGDSSGRIYSQNSLGTFDGTAISTSVYRNDFYLDSDRDKVKYPNRVILIFKDLGITSSVKFKWGRRLTDGTNTLTFSTETTIALQGFKTSYVVNLVPKDNAGKLFSWQLSTIATEPGFQLEQIIVEYTTGGIV